MPGRLGSTLFQQQHDHFFRTLVPIDNRSSLDQSTRLEPKTCGTLRLVRVLKNDGVTCTGDEPGNGVITSMALTSRRSGTRARHKSLSTTECSAVVDLQRMATEWQQCEHLYLRLRPGSLRHKAGLAIPEFCDGRSHSSFG